MIHEKLLKIQTELKAPKDKFNLYGNFPYRSAEGILEAVKPLCKANNVCLVLNDEIVNIGTRFYVKSTVTLTDTENGDIVATTAYAREDETKKGMDGSQITGACSSYARKYALNGLFNIDDTKDADTNEFHEQTKPSKPQPDIVDVPVSKNEYDLMMAKLLKAKK